MTRDQSDQNDLIKGLAANDRLVGGNSDDQILGGTGNDRLIGEDGADKLLGGSGDDRLVGRSGDDDLRRGRGQDFLFCGEGSDVLVGNGGQDVFRLTPGSGQITIVDFRDRQDQLELSNTLSFSDLTITQQGNNTLIQTSNDVLATLQGIQSSRISRADFMTGV